jgi:23S rRNA (cytidine1920-2'-O)/16S rRNA (cytidine1409-2'-O)-methyltransferase
MRADVFLVEKGFAASRSEAQSAIAAGNVVVDGRKIAKPSQRVPPDASVAYAPAHPYVSRGALKLIAALDTFGFSPEGRICLDVGASTGGFTEVLLGRGAAKVYAVDVGHGQLHAKLAREPRVVSLEGVNIRDFDPASVGPVAAIVADVSFIGLKLALPRALAAATENCWLAVLVKPQFEVGRGKIGKNGIVRKDADGLLSAADIVKWLYDDCGWNIVGMTTSPILGGGGNREYLVGARRDGPRRNLTEFA